MTHHAAIRLQERYGARLTPDLEAEIFDHIRAAQAHGCEHELAVRLAVQPQGRERWLVSAGGLILHTVVVPRPVLITVLPPNSKGFRP